MAHLEEKAMPFEKRAVEAKTRKPVNQTSGDQEPAQKLTEDEVYRLIAEEPIPKEHRNDGKNDGERS